MMITIFFSVPVILTRMKLSVGYWSIWKAFIEHRFGKIIYSILKKNDNFF